MNTWQDAAEDLRQAAAGVDAQALGAELHELVRELYPICRSITGEGLRATLRRIQQEIPITINEVPSGTPVLDWTVPDEWNIRYAWIADPSGRRVIDFGKSNLHVVSYSMPVRQRMRFDALKPHLHTVRGHPSWIPYRTTYYTRDWGFCVAEDQFASLQQGELEVCIDSSLAPGALSYGELVIPGESTDEFLFSAHCCHPSLANDNLSGVVSAVFLARELLQRPFRHHTCRFLFAPGTIGAITWLAQHEAEAKRVKHGLVLTCVGDAAGFTFKRSRRGDAVIDRAVEQVLASRREPYRCIDFSPYGYDERQFCSPGFNLPVGCLMRSQHGTFPEYHTSADDLGFIKPESLAGTLAVLIDVIELIETRAVQSRAEVSEPKEVADAPQAQARRRFINLKPKGEPQLGRYGVYQALAGDVLPALWVLNLSDGGHSLGDICRRSLLSFDSLAKAADVLAAVDLVKEV